MQKVLLALPAATAAFLAFLLWPTDAHAWGPLTHLDFSQGALANLGAVSGALRILLTKCADDFLYGSLAADIVVGKNLARYAVHCHNWKVGWQVFERARGEPQQAFALGFLAHLAADTVAHNYYVPFKTVQGFSVRGSGHAYWELRYDQRLDPQLWRTARRITARAFRRHDEFLQEALADSSVIPFGVSKRVFDQLLLAARMKKYQAMSAVVAAERDALPLTGREIAETRSLAVGQILCMLAHGDGGRATTADPTGGRNLHFALKLRQSLREAARRDQLDPVEAARVVEEARPAFREAIHGKLVIPELPLRGGVAPLVEAASNDAIRVSTEQLEDEAVAREAEEVA